MRERRAWREQRLELQGLRPSPWASPARRGLEGLARPWVPGLDFLLLWVLGQGCASPSLLPAVNLFPQGNQLTGLGLAHSRDSTGNWLVCAYIYIHCSTLDTKYSANLFFFHSTSWN